MKRKMWFVHAALAAYTAFAVVVVGQTPATKPAATTRPSHADEFTVKPTAGVTQVSVRSHATLGSFTSTSNQVTGRFRFDRQNPETFAGRFSLPLTSIHTGIRLRDHDLRSTKWFDAANYPDVVIAISRARDVHKESADTMTMTLVGTNSMHGVTQDVHIPVTLTTAHESATTGTQAGRDTVSIRTQFEFRLSDYQVKGSKPLGMKVDDVQRVNVSVYATEDTSGSPAAKR